MGGTKQLNSLHQRILEPLPWMITSRLRLREHVVNNKGHDQTLEVYKIYDCDYKINVLTTNKG